MNYIAVLIKSQINRFEFKLCFAILFLVRMVGLHLETRLIEDWLGLDIAVKWCEEHNVPYKVDIPKGYQKDYPEDALRDSAEKIRYTAREKGVTSPFDWLNGMKDNSLFMAEF